MESLCADRCQVVRYLAQKCPVQHYFEAFEPADTSRKGLRGREEVLEKSNTWPEQVLDTLNSCWRALLESLSNTQANVRRSPLMPGAISVYGDKNELRQRGLDGAHASRLRDEKPRAPKSAAVCSVLAAPSCSRLCSPENTLCNGRS